jgi:hypothetical protein
MPDSEILCPNLEGGEVFCQLPPDTFLYGPYSTLCTRPNSTGVQRTRYIRVGREFFRLKFIFGYLPLHTIGPMRLSKREYLIFQQVYSGDTVRYATHKVRESS